MSLAAIILEFDAVFRLTDDLAVRWQTVALALVIAAVLGGVGLAARRRGLRADDLLFLVVGAVPGAVVGGRLGDVIGNPDAYAGAAAWLDPSLGGMELGLAVVGGILSAAYVTLLLGAPVGRWAGLLAVPLLLVIGLGKLTMIVGGAGQGLPFDGAWATAFQGPGPWGSLAAEIPSHPSQAYEGLATLALAGLLAAGSAVPGRGRADGGTLALAVAGWAAIRVAVSTTWRDPALLGPIPATGVLAAAIAILALAAFVLVRSWLPRRRAARDALEPSWPDPETRPQF